jgi:pyruvate formate lyase activating enzyme
VSVEGERGGRALIVNIKRNALDDGPGIRSLVFFKGCPLRCVWCHNPETKSPARELMFRPSVCIGCGDCAALCEPGAIVLGRQERIDRSACDLCMECVEACPSGALTMAGRHVGLDELEQELLRDEPFYRHSGGGVTWSGGEPTVHLDFLSEISVRLRQRSIHQNLETCGLYRREKFEETVLPNLDLVYFDLKFVDPALHERYTGKPSDAILANLASLLARPVVPVRVRIPLVPDVTATDENLSALAGHLRGLGVSRVELLEYNPLWHDKAESLGQEITYSRRTFLTPDEKDLARRCFEGFDLGRF